MTEPDLNLCDLEPIHLSGKIQSHGFLLVVNSDFIITNASENVMDLLGLQPIAILGKTINIINEALGKNETTDFIKGIVAAATGHNSFDPHNPYSISINKNEWLLIIHRVGYGFILDFEPEHADLQVDLQQFLGRSLSRILSNTNLKDILVNSAQQIKQIIQYDRVMIYKFDEDGHGEVVAESKNEVLEPWLGLHFPASDIPKQARELYKLNLTRLISNVNTSPSSICGLSKEPVDLTDSTLRAVSPIHIQYLKNMGVASSFSVSIICDNDLWGLIACHNYTPRFINFRHRESSKLLGQVLSSAIHLRQQEAEQLVSIQHQKAVEALTRSLSRKLSIGEALFKNDVTLMDAIPSTGAVMLLEYQFHKMGNVPDENFLKQFCKWLAEHHDMDVFCTNSLIKLYPEANGLEKIASGVMACRLAKNLNEFIIWFRPQIPTIVSWAGRQEKYEEKDINGLPYISPGKSFETWSELVEHTATPWQTNERDCALEIRDEINYSINRKALELRILNEELIAAYAELDTFAHTISHDLKNPLTAIKGYAQILGSSEALDKTHRHIGKSIEASANKMGRMLEEILSYSKIGEFKLELKEIDMAGLLEEIRIELMLGKIKPELKVIIRDTPNIYGDSTMISQLFSNLISNAIKYSENVAIPEVTISAEVLPDSIIYSIEDNGIGIKSDDHQHIFDLFSRSSNALSFSGSGVGLSIVKRIVEKHRAEIWLKSELGKGSCFFVNFKKSMSEISNINTSN